MPDVDVPHVALAVALGDGTSYGRGPSVWIGTLQPVLRNRDITGVVVSNGPAGSKVVIYFDATLIDTTPYGVENQQDYANPKRLYKGQTMRVIWSLGTGTTPKATVDYRLK